MAVLINVDGTEERILPTGETFTLNEIYAVVECDTVESIFISDGSIMMVDEDAVAKNKRINNRATMIYSADRKYPRGLVAGKVLICNRKEIK